MLFVVFAFLLAVNCSCQEPASPRLCEKAEEAFDSLSKEMSGFVESGIKFEKGLSERIERLKAESQVISKYGGVVLWKSGRFEFAGYLSSISEDGGNVVLVGGTSRVVTVDVSKLDIDQKDDIKKIREYLSDFEQECKEVVFELKRLKAAPPFLKKGLIAYYSFNCDSKDESDSNNGGVSANVEYVVDRFGRNNRAVHFKGDASSFVEAPFKLDRLDELSISFWLKCPSIPRGKFGSVFISVPRKELRPPGSGLQLYVLPESGVVGVVVCNDLADHKKWPRAQTKMGIAGEKFCHGVVVVGDGRLQFFLDGKLVGEEDYVARVVPEGKIQFGRSFDRNSSMGLNPALACVLDDIRIYDRALTDEEVASLYIHEALSTPTSED